MEEIIMTTLLTTPRVGIWLCTVTRMYDCHIKLEYLIKLAISNNFFFVQFAHQAEMKSSTCSLGYSSEPLVVRASDTHVHRTQKAGMHLTVRGCLGWDCQEDPEFQLAFV